MTNGEVLNSWKEIATYLGRGVRTVQRWELELDLPVRRPRGKQRSAVIAFTRDLDLWLRMPHAAPAPASLQIVYQKNHAKLVENTQLLKLRTQLLKAQSAALKIQIARARSILELRYNGSAGKIAAEGSPDPI